jgi:hypothetical protein
VRLLSRRCHGPRFAASTRTARGGVSHDDDSRSRAPGAPIGVRCPAMNEPRNEGGRAADSPEVSAVAIRSRVNPRRWRRRGRTREINASRLLGRAERST